MCVWRGSTIKERGACPGFGLTAILPRLCCTPDRALSSARLCLPFFLPNRLDPRTQATPRLFCHIVLMPMTCCFAHSCVPCPFSCLTLDLSAVKQHERTWPALTYPLLHCIPASSYFRVPRRPFASPPSSPPTLLQLLCYLPRILSRLSFDVTVWKRRQLL